MLDRTVHATEALLVRAKRAFRNAYERGGAAVRIPSTSCASRRSRRPRPALRRRPARRLAAALDAAGLPTVNLPERSTTMTDTATATAAARTAR